MFMLIFTHEEEKNFQTFLSTHILTGHTYISSQGLGVIRNMFHFFCKTFPEKLGRDHHLADK